MEKCVEEECSRWRGGLSKSSEVTSTWCTLKEQVSSHPRQGGLPDLANNKFYPELGQTY